MDTNIEEIESVTDEEIAQEAIEMKTKGPNKDITILSTYKKARDGENNFWRQFNQTDPVRPDTKSKEWCGPAATYLALRHFGELSPLLTSPYAPSKYNPSKPEQANYANRYDTIHSSLETEKMGATWPTKIPWGVRKLTNSRITATVYEPFLWSNSNIKYRMERDEPVLMVQNKGNALHWRVVVGYGTESLWQGKWNRVEKWVQVWELSWSWVWKWWGGFFQSLWNLITKKEWTMEWNPQDTLLTTHYYLMHDPWGWNNGSNTWEISDGYSKGYWFNHTFPVAIRKN